MFSLKEGKAKVVWQDNPTLRKVKASVGKGIWTHLRWSTFKLLFRKTEQQKRPQEEKQACHKHLQFSHACPFVKWRVPLHGKLLATDGAETTLPILPCTCSERECICTGKMTFRGDAHDLKEFDCFGSIDAEPVNNQVLQISRRQWARSVACYAMSRLQHRAPSSST